MKKWNSPRIIKLDIKKITLSGSSGNNESVQAKHRDK